MLCKVFRKIRIALTLLFLFLILIACHASTATASIDESTKTAALVSHFNANLIYANASASYLFAEVDVNLTQEPNQTMPVDGVTDFYKVELISNGRVIGSNIRGCTIGQGLSKEQMTSLSMNYGHIGFSTINYNQEILKWDIWYDPTNPTFVEPLTVRLTRMGWVIVDNNEWLFSLNYNETVQEVQLSKVENSYIYGNPIPDAIPTEVTPSPSVPEFSWLTILPLIAALTTAAIVQKVRPGQEKLTWLCQ